MCDGCLLNTQWTSYPLRCPLEPLYNFVQSFVVVPTVSTRHCLTSSALSRYDDWWSSAAANVWFDWSALTTAQVVSWSQMSTLQKRWDTPRACKEIPHSNTCVELHSAMTFKQTGVALRYVEMWRLCCFIRAKCTSEKMIIECWMNLNPFHV